MKLNQFFAIFFILTLSTQLVNGRRKKKIYKVMAGCPMGCKCTKQSKQSEEYSASCRLLSFTEIPQTFGVQKHWVNVDLSVNNISVIDEKSFDNVHRIENLKISRNSISEIHPASFKKLHSITELNLERNEIPVIPDRLFSDSRNILQLRLASNQLTNLTAESFAGLHNLNFLLLDHNHFTVVPIEALKQTPKLKLLSLSMNQISYIPDDAFSLLKDLAILNLRENQISTIGNHAFDSLAFCDDLDLSYNLLTEYPKTVTRLRNLTKLKLQNNHIKHLPSRAFAYQRNLEILTFHNNPFPQVGRWTFAHLINLTSLLILDVEEQNYFPELSNCVKLQQLSVTEGHMINLPPDLCNHKPFFKHLNVAGNRLYNLSGLEHCASLETIDASNNLLYDLKQKETFNLTSLKDLNLSGNKIRTMEWNCFANMSLERLNLADNPLSALPVRGMEKVNILNLSNTRNLYYLPPKQYLPGLHHLQATYPCHCCLTFKELCESNKNAKYDELISCSPQQGPLTPCTDLLEPNIGRVLLWVVFVFTFMSNTFIIMSKVRRTFFRSNNISVKQNTATCHLNCITTGNSESFALHHLPDTYLRKLINFDTFDIAFCHLSFADMIAAIYILIIVVYDAESRGNFVENAAWWQESGYCRTAGFFLVMGLQLSFYTIFVATLERYVTTMFPLNPEKHFGKPVLGLALCASWVISICTGVITLYNKGVYERSYKDNPLPSYNGALCLPWSTDFPFVAILVSAHIIVCGAMVIFSALMYCTKQKQSWLSAQKYTRLQIALTVACNIVCVLPIALIGLLASAIITFPSAAEPWLNTETQAAEELNVSLLLVICMLLISLRLVLNPILYIAFNKDFRSDLVQFMKVIACLNTSTKNSRQSNLPSIQDEMSLDGVGDKIAYYFQTINNHSNSENKLALLEPVSIYGAPNSSEISQQFLQQNKAEAYEDRTNESEDNESLKSFSTVLGRHLLSYSSDPETSYGNDAEDEAESSSEDMYPQMEVFHDFQGDPFLISNMDNYGERSRLLLDFSEKQADTNEDHENSNTHLPNYAATTSISKEAVRCNGMQDAKERKSSTGWLTHIKNHAVTDHIMSHSSESSTSKDSGIQSEPDLGLVAPSSSSLSTASQSQKIESKSSKRELPLFLVPTKKSTETKLRTQSPEVFIRHKINCLSTTKPLREAVDLDLGGFLSAKEEKLKLETIL